MRQPLWFISGVQKPQYEKARFIEGAAEWAVVELRDEVAQSVVSAYSDWVRAVARIEVGKSDAIYYGQLLGMITRRIMSGASAEVEKRLVTSRLLMAISERTANQAAERASREKLSQLVQSQVTYEELKRGVATVPYLPSMEELRQLVVLRNPTLHRLSKEGEALIVDSEVQRQALLPQLYVSAERLYAENNSANSDDSVLSVGVEWSPGAGFSTRSAISSAERRAEALQASRAAAQQELEENIHNLYVQLQSTLERQALIEENYRNQLQVRDSYLRQFMSGRRSWQEVMNAVRDVSDSQYSQADIRSQLITLGYRLGIQAYGDGFKPLDGDYSEIGLGERLL